MSTVVDAVGSDDEKAADRDPFAGEAIEIDDATLRRMSPGAWAGRVTSRIDASVQRIIYGR
nr:hypothetical protein [Natronosalvus vescus]